MEVEDLIRFWDFDGPLATGDEIRCPECGEWSSHKEWIETDTYCSDCGSHLAIQCPMCDEKFDCVYSPTFEIREPDNKPLAG